MSMSASQRPVTAFNGKPFLIALAVNFVWINLSEILRYFLVVRPVLRNALPGTSDVALITPAIFVSWMVWDTILIIAATGFFWMWLERMGATWHHAFVAATLFTLTVFGLLWLGVINMGLAPVTVMLVAMPLALAEQIIAALLVTGVYRKCAE